MAELPDTSASPVPVGPRRIPTPRWHWVARIVLVAWGGFWTWFVAMELIGEPSTRSLYYGALVVVPIWIGCVAGWLNARVGSFVLLGVAALMALYFKHPLVWTPPIMAGLILAAGRFYGKR